MDLASWPAGYEARMDWGQDYTTISLYREWTGNETTTSTLHPYILEWTVNATTIISLYLYGLGCEKIPVLPLHYHTSSDWTGNVADEGG